jgi:septal ring factor EnvC (AmiA/AmiB activator)
LAELGEDRKQVEAALAGLQAQRRDLAARIEAQRRRLSQLLRSSYERGATTSIPLLLSGEDPGAAARNARYLGYLYRAHVQRFDALRADLSALETLDAATRQNASQVAELERRQAGERDKLVRQKAARDAQLRKAAVEIDRQRREIGTLRRNEAHLARLVRRLAEALATRKRKPASPARHAGISAPEEAPDPDAAFARLRGRLPLPVRGELAGRFGSPREDTGVPWHGVCIATPGGAPVQAVATGRVVFSDWLRGYGNLLILDHGEGFMTLYANAEALLRQVGAEVGAGERVAIAGQSGGNAQTGLYFEVRYRGRPLDPLRWVNAR